MALPEARGRATLHLLLYSLALTLPLIAVICVGFLHTALRWLESLVTHQRATITLLTAGPCLLLGSCLVKMA